MTTDNLPEQYEKFLGQEKFCRLRQLFLADAEEKMKRADYADDDELKLIFHTLRSSSLVFGMKEFAETCRRIEEKLLNGEGISKNDLAKSKEILKNNIQNVIKHFNAADEND